MLTSSEGAAALAEVRGLSTSRGGRRVLDGLDLTLRPGRLGLVGLNGAGKSTLFDALLGLVAWDAGDITVGGVSLRDRHILQEHRRRTGWLPQQPGFPPAMRVDDFVAYAAWLKEYPAAATTAAVSGALDRTDTAHLAHRRMGALSGGERQRVFLAAALVTRPDVVLLDEPTAGLDPRQREHFLDLLLAFPPEVCVVVATHLYEDLAGTVGDIAVLAGGRIASTIVCRDLVAPGARVDVETVRAAVAPVLG